MLRLYQNNVTWYNKQKFDMNPTNLIRNHHKNTAQKMLEQDREGSVNDLLDVAEDPLDLIHVHCKRRRRPTPPPRRSPSPRASSTPRPTRRRAPS
jgi:hypothetical protein